MKAQEPSLSLSDVQQALSAVLGGLQSGSSFSNGPAPPHALQSIAGALDSIVVGESAPPDMVQGITKILDDILSGRSSFEAAAHPDLLQVMAAVLDRTLSHSFSSDSSSVAPSVFLSEIPTALRSILRPCPAPGATAPLERTRQCSASCGVAVAPDSRSLVGRVSVIPGFPDSRKSWRCAALLGLGPAAPEAAEPPDCRGCGRSCRACDLTRPAAELIRGGGGGGSSRCPVYAECAPSTASPPRRGPLSWLMDFWGSESSGVPVRALTPEVGVAATTRPLTGSLTGYPGEGIPMAESRSGTSTRRR